MKYRHPWLLSFSCLLFSLTAAVRAQDLSKLTFLTEDFPPYNFEVNGVPQGISVDLLVKALQEAHAGVTRHDIKYWPWARSYRLLQHEPNIVLFTTLYTSARKPLFKWVGPITESQVVLLAKKSSHIVIRSPQDILKYDIAVIRDDVGEQLVRALGVPRSNMSPVSDGIMAARMLNANRVSLWAYDENVAFLFLKQAGFETKNYESVYVLHRGEEYYAVSKSTSDTLVKALQDAITQVKTENGGATYRAILAKYR